MSNYKYILEPYKGIKTRFPCPNCKRRNQFVKYIDTETKNYLDEKVGKCNRQINCGYHYTPKQFFKDYPSNNIPKNTFSEIVLKSKTLLINSCVSFIPANIFKKSLQNYSKNNFVIFLENIFGKTLALELVKRYAIGSSKHWKGSTVFWQIDKNGNIHTGKIILYDKETGKRIKIPFNYISWAHSVLKINNFRLIQCLFGEHLLNENLIKPIAIVESEKTAIIASVYLPEFIWLATGGIGNLNSERIKPLTHRKIYLFPDIGCFNDWKEKAIKIEKILKCKIEISDFLEQNATSYDFTFGFDIADFLITRENNYGLALSEYNYPISWDYREF